MKMSELSRAVVGVLDGLRIGSVRYLNARPLIEPYERLGRHVRLEHPAVLAAALAAGELDVALVPVVEALRSPEDWLVEGVGIGARGPVWSVFVAYREERPEEITKLALDPASMTSANLCQVLFKEWGRLPRLIPFAELEEGTARLLIGDQANAFRRDHPADGWNYLDLGEAWLRFTGLPFVFAGWVMRPEIPQPEQAAAAFRELAKVGRSAIDRVAAQEADPVFAKRYLTGFLRYNLGPEEKAGVERFRELLRKHGQIGEADAPIRWI